MQVRTIEAKRVDYIVAISVCTVAGLGLVLVLGVMVAVLSYVRKECLRIGMENRGLVPTVGQRSMTEDYVNTRS